MLWGSGAETCENQVQRGGTGKFLCGLGDHVWGQLSSTGTCNPEQSTECKTRQPLSLSLSCVHTRARRHTLTHPHPFSPILLALEQLEGAHKVLEAKEPLHALEMVGSWSCSQFLSAYFWKLPQEKHTRL